MYKIILSWLFLLSALNAAPSSLLPESSGQGGSTREDIYKQCKAKSKHISEYRECKEKRLKEFNAMEQVQKRMGSSSYSDGSNQSDDTPFTRHRDILVSKLDASIEKMNMMRNCLATSTGEDEMSQCKSIQNKQFVPPKKESVEQKDYEVKPEQEVARKPYPTPKQNKLPLPPIRGY